MFVWESSSYKLKEQTSDGTKELQLGSQLFNSRVSSLVSVDKGRRQLRPCAPDNWSNRISASSCLSAAAAYELIRTWTQLRV